MAQEWLGWKDPQRMLGALGREGSRRKMRLFACACVRRAWALVMRGDEATAVAVGRLVEAVEGHLDGAVAEGEVVAAWEGVPTERDTPCRMVGLTLRNVALASFGNVPHAAWLAAEEVEWAFMVHAPEATDKAIRVAQAGRRSEEAALLRELFFAPQHPVVFASVWRAPDVVALATAAYHERELPSGLLRRDLLGVLADALEEAGCPQAPVLGHLRGPGQHVRGCWVVDLCLGLS